MARIRSVHPGLFTDEAFVVLTISDPLAIPLLLGLWCVADDFGAFEWNPFRLKSLILPMAPVGVGELLDALARGNFIKRFEIEGRPLGVLRNFALYQRPKKPRAVHPFTAESRAFAGFSQGATPITGFAVARTAPNCLDSREG